MIMAVFQNIFKQTKLLGSRASSICSSIIPHNGMSQYPSYYVPPIYKKELQNALIKDGEIQKLTHIPIKAALIDQTCSATHDAEVNLMINYLMKDGKKVLARSLMDKCFEHIKKIQLAKYNRCETEEGKSAIELNPKVIFHEAVENCKPIMCLTPIKRGGVRYQVPVPISAKRAQFFSMKWLIAASKEKESTVRFSYQMALELIDAANNTGKVIRKKQDLHRQCEANRAYAHYRWG
ncbi:28S ribosomal protein S7, mitochondrial [Coccinella septempunctata]|uniref:28S ribosomal protein S7, mitochondrial n=1 Tax=Coccinella septempunctata TaxID=41139 RepID=UPI001D09146B|nr:28S ribosomal protein S7, mitochondrial [Coccinella septempunctata]